MATERETFPPFIMDDECVAIVGVIGRPILL